MTEIIQGHNRSRWQRHHSGGGVVLMLCLVVVVVVVICEASSPQSPRPPQVPLPSQSINPFNTERTGVSGFGSRSKRKTIFGTPNPKLDLAIKQQQQQQRNLEKEEQEKQTEEIDESSTATTTTTTTKTTDLETLLSARSVTADVPSSSASTMMSSDVAAEIFLDTDAMTDDEDVENGEDENENELEEQQQQVTTTKRSNRRRLYALRSSTDLWIRIEDDDDEEEAGDQETSSSSSNVQLLRLFVSEKVGDWKVERRNLEDDPASIIKAVSPAATSSTVLSSKSMKQMKKDKSKHYESTGKNKKKLHLQPEDEDDQMQQQQQWVPIEGLYGMYRVPTGYLWVLITQSELVYTTPPPSALQWQIRRVSNLEIVHVGRSSPTTAIQQHKLKTTQLREEVRQLRLFRRAMKYHDFYFYANNNKNSGSGSILSVSDVTKPLQRSMIMKNNHKDSRSWWETTKQQEQPDPRFFWNQGPVQPILREFQMNETETSTIDHDLAGMLLGLVIPVTSAFVGAQTVTVASQVSPSSDTEKDQTSTTASSSKNCSSYKLSYDEILISRRSRFRAGTRFTVRGADATGAVANFVETEQICVVKNIADPNNESIHSLSSQVQTRGSIPLRWSSPADMKTYAPRVHIGTDPIAQARALKLHLLDQMDHYTLPRDDVESSGTSSQENPALMTSDDTMKQINDDSHSMIFVNLVDKKKDQGRLGMMFDSVLQAVLETDGNSTTLDDRDNTTSSHIRANSAKHHWFDFHREVKNGRWDRLGKLLDDMKVYLVNHGYFSAAPSRDDGKDWKVQRKQHSVIRTNCMDCLDRTNVVQSLFGRYMLFRQLSFAASEIFGDGPAEAKRWWEKLIKEFQNNPLTLPFQDGEMAHRLLWADNADAISILYSGTNALKRDFTRTGRRTKMGALDDGMNSLQRYYLNNFLDADRQEGYDLMVGHIGFNFLDDDDGDGTSDDEKLKGVGARSIDDMLWGSPEEPQEVWTGSSSLGLNWIPGDLQSHLKSKTTFIAENERTNFLKGGGYAPYQALRALESRSGETSETSPWWTQYPPDDWIAEKTDFQRDLSVSVEHNHAGDLHKQQIVTLPLQLAVMLALGLRAPIFVASIAVAILAFLYAREMIEEYNSSISPKPEAHSNEE